MREFRHKIGESVPKTKNKGEFRNKTGEFVLEMSFEGRIKHKTLVFVLGMRLILPPPPSLCLKE